MTSNSGIQRYGDARRWADVVVHAGVARWVEVAADLQQDFEQQVRQVLQQIDETLQQLRSDRTCLLQILIYIADLNQVAVLNTVWDGWVPDGHPPVRACVQAGLGAGCLVEMVITAAVPQ